MSPWMPKACCKVLVCMAAACICCCTPSCSTCETTQLYACRQDSTFEGKTTFSTSVLVGKRDEPLLTIAARQLVELAHSKGISK
jgi:hypothetical protein